MSGDNEIQRLIPPKALVLAPMSGVTDPPFRFVAREKGADLAYTEMVSAEGLVRKNAQSTRLLKAIPTEGPLMAQLYGSDPTVLAEAASMVQEKRMDGVDINAGCPADKVVKRGAGAALLREPARLRKILTKVRDAIHIPLGVKLRSGWDEGSINALQIVQMAEDCGVDLVTIHPRLRSQRFGGDANWNLIRMAKEGTGMVIIGNGDIRSPADAARMFTETKCDGVMIGRKSLGDPWIFERVRGFIHEGRDIPPPTWEEREGLIIRHMEMILQRDDTHPRLPIAIRHLGWYVKGFPAAAEFRRRINAVKAVEVLFREIEGYFQRIRRFCKETGDAHN